MFPPSPFITAAWMKLPRRSYRSGYIPSQVTVYAAQRGATHAAEGQALLIYHEGESLVSAITENGKLSLARTLEGAEPAQLQMDLPQLALSAALQGINTTFSKRPARRTVPFTALDGRTCFHQPPGTGGRGNATGFDQAQPSSAGLAEPARTTR